MPNGRQAGGCTSSILQNQEAPGFKVREQVAHLSKEEEVEGYSSADGKTVQGQRIWAQPCSFPSLGEGRKIYDMLNFSG